MSRFEEIDPFDLEDEFEDIYFDGDDLDDDSLYDLHEDDEYDLLDED